MNEEKNEILSKDDANKVQEQYNKFPEMKCEDVLRLVKWIEEQPHLPNVTEYEAIHFYHSCYYDMEKAKMCADNYYTLRTDYKEFFAQRDVFGKDIENSMNISVMIPLPGLTPDGYKVMYCRLTDSDYTKLNFESQMKYFSFFTDLWLKDEGIAKGHVLIYDMNGFLFGHMTKMRIGIMKKFLHYLQEALPFRLKALHYLNTVWFLHKILALIRPFMKQELQDMLYFHRDLTTLTPHIPQEMLPAELGGEAGTISELHEMFSNKIKDNAEYFLNEEKTQRVNESLRPKPVKK